MKNIVFSLRQFGLKGLFIACAVLSLCNTTTVHAVSPDDIYSINNNTAFYDGTDGGGSGGTCGGTTIPNGTLPSFIPEPYNGAFTAAGAKYKVSPLLIAGLFTEEHFTNDDPKNLPGRWKNLPKNQPDPNSGWATSPTGASGPFQFIPSTWDSLGVDGNHDGKKDVQNIVDASFGAGNYAAHDGATADTPESKWEKFANGYGGNAVFNGVTYGQHVIQYVDYYKTGSSIPTPPTSNSTTDSSGATCSGGEVAGNIAQTAINLSWADGPHGASDGKASYISALNKYDNGGAGGADCGSFVATVVRASGADKNYPQSGTPTQIDYLNRQSRSTLGKWQSIPNLGNTSDLQPGDVFIVNQGFGAAGHTFVYIGKQANGNNIAEASLNDQMPYQNKVFFSDQRGKFSIFRFKG